METLHPLQIQEVHNLRLAIFQERTNYYNCIEMLFKSKIGVKPTLNLKFVSVINAGCTKAETLISQTYENFDED